jgi:5'-3' exonuclease
VATHILLDLSHLGHAAAANKHRLSAGSVDTTAIYGVVQCLHRVASQFNGQITALLDGRSWRHVELADYKAGRAQSPDGIALKERWKASKPWVSKILPTLGINQIFSKNLEADDLAARMRRRFIDRGDEVLLISGDKDWLQLIEAGCWVYNTITEKRINAANFTEATGLPQPRSIAERKALIGKAQEMDGVGGIGEKTAQEIFAQFGSVDGMLNSIIVEGTKVDGRATKLLDEAVQQRFRQNMRLAWLDHPGLPPAAGTIMVPGQFDKARFRDLCGELAFHSLLQAGDSWLEPFLKRS